MTLTNRTMSDYAAMAAQVNTMLRNQDMHADQHHDGLIFGQIPGTDDWGIHNQSLLFANKRSKETSRRYATTYMLLREYNESDSERYGWTLPHTKEPALIPQIKHGPLYTGLPRALTLAQVEQNLLYLRGKIWDSVRGGLKMTPRVDTTATYFALQMVSSSTDTDWHIPSLSMDPRLQQYLLAGVHAPLVFIALATAKQGTARYIRGGLDLPPARISVHEAQAMNDLQLSIVFQMLNIDLFDAP